MDNCDNKQQETVTPPIKRIPAFFTGKQSRSKRPRLENGKPGKPEYITPQSHAELATALENGRSLHRLQRDIRKLEAQIERLELRVEVVLLR